MGKAGRKMVVTPEYVEPLWNILERFCGEPLLGKIRSSLAKAQGLEARLLRKAAGRTREVRRLDEGFPLDAVITECQHALPRESFYDLLLEVGSLCLLRGEFAEAKALFGQVIKGAVGSRKCTAAAGRAMLRRAELYLRQAKWRPALDDLRRSRRIFTRLKDEFDLGRVENSFGVYYAEHGDLKRAAAHMRKARLMFEKTKHSDMAAAALMDLGILANIAGKWDEAFSFYSRALPRFEERGDLSRLAELHHNLAMVLVSKGEQRAALGQFDESLTYSNQLGYQPLIALSTLGKSAVHSRLGDYPLSLALANRALSIFRQLDDRLSLADAYKIKAIVQREMRNLDVSELYLHTSIRINEEYSNPVNLAESYVELGKLYAVRGDLPRASLAFRAAIRYFGKIGATRDRRRVTSQLQLLKRGTLS